jgi:murein DD-endopeptidase MepM/ murein hydrolase activator NlpD
VKIRHVNGYVSYYAHLSRFGAGLRVGKTVRQKEIIGYVGHTGLATGSHVCFRIAKDGQYVNPMKLRGPKPSPVADESWARFAAVRDQLLRRLEVNTALVAEEAL